MKDSDRPPSQAELPARVAALVHSHTQAFGFRPPPEFSSHLETFAAILAQWGVRTNLTARPDNPEEIAFHIVDSLAPTMIAPQSPVLTDAFEVTHHVLDLGSGAGFPGLILAMTMPAQFLLVEARHRRASFLQVTAVAMNLHNVTVRPHVDANDRAAFDIVTSRAFGTPELALETAANALKRGGHVILYLNPSQRIAEDLGVTYGLAESARYEYSVERDGTPLKRALMVWKKT
ncbi:MAG: 16S rRNA (guanine(527)-N(7))-methyltransferase RsmG [Candidatus Binataceae bacterium]